MTGVFAAPAYADLPTGYTELEYIESTGTQYINSNYIFTTNSGVLDIDFIKVTPNSTAKQGWGSYISFSDNRCLGVWFDTTKHYAQVGGNNLQFPSQITTGERHHLVMSAVKGQAVITLDGTEVINSEYTKSHLYTLKGLILQYVNYSTIKLIFKKEWKAIL